MPPPPDASPPASGPSTPCRRSTPSRPDGSPRSTCRSSPAWEPSARCDCPSVRIAGPDHQEHTMTPDDLVEIERIKRLKYKYLRCLDQKLWDEIETCFTPDATARYGGGLYEFENRDAIMEFLRTSMGATTMLSSHRCH